MYVQGDDSYGQRLELGKIGSAIGMGMSLMSPKLKIED